MDNVRHEDKASFFSFHVEPFTDDVTSHLSWRNLGLQLLACAGYHADTHGFGFEHMSQYHRAWVLSRLVMDFEDRPCTHQEYCIETFVNKVYRQFTDRMFIVSTGDKTLGYGYSTWALIDYETRMPVNLDDLPNGGFQAALTDRTLPIDGPGRIRVKSQEPVASHHVGFTDLDVNGHVNSMRYIELLLDQYITNAEQTIRRIDIAYAHETMLGENLLIFKEGEHQYEIRKEDGSLVVRAEIL